MSTDATLAQLLALRPPGPALPDAPDSALALALRPAAAGLAVAEDAIAGILPQQDPRAATDLLPDFERLLGDDPCLGPSAALPFGIRQTLAHQRWTGRGGASIAYFTGIAAALGVPIGITEMQPFETGASQSGDESVPEAGRFEWVVSLPATTLIEFETGVAETGQPMGDFVASPIECVFRRLSPAHTVVTFSYGA